jgi:RND family efflux transporter MFP subunit
LHDCTDVGCGGGDARASTAASAAAGEVAAIPVAVATAIKRDVPTVVRATGTFTPDESSDVAPQVSGQVLKTLANVGDTVNADQPLVLLDDRDARLRLDQARASLERAEADAQHAKADASRSGELLQKGFTPRSDFERLATQDTGAGAAVAQARAQLASAQKAVDDTIVRAPFSGHVTARPVAAGEYVTPASKIATIVRIQPIKLELMVKEVDAVKVRRGLSVEAEVSGYPGVVFVGLVSALNVAIDPNSR